MTAFVVFVERGQRRIQVNYAKRQQGRRLYAGQSTHLPFKLNMSGVIPPIFASSLLLFPATIASWSGTSGGLSWLQNVAAAMTPGQPAHMVLYGGLIIFFAFFYTALVFNSRETAENLKKSGAFIPGIRPGQQTGEYIDKVLTRLTVWGALYVTVVCLLPEFLISRFSVPFYFGGTSLLIMVVVIMDFQAQVAAHLMSHQYEGLMKKANLRGYGRPGQTRGRVVTRCSDALLTGPVAHTTWRTVYEGSCFRQEDLQELQDRAPPPGGVRDLLRRAPQAASGLMTGADSFVVK